MRPVDLPLRLGLGVLEGLSLFLLLAHVQPTSVVDRLVARLIGDGAVGRGPGI